MKWHGYVLITVKTKLTNDTKDEEGIVTKKGTKSQTDDDFKLLGNQSGLPHKITHTRISLDGQQYIVELETSSKPVKADFLGVITTNAVKTGLAIQVFNGNNWEERRKDCIQYLIDNMIDWESVI